jgi:hypothetical protein
VLRSLKRRVRAARERARSPFGISEELAELARRSAEAGYRGPREEEPLVRSRLNELRAELALAYRGNTALRDAQVAELAARQAVGAAESTRDAAFEETDGDMKELAAVADDPSLVSQAVRVRGSMARTRREEAADAARAARRDHERASTALQGVDTLMVDRLGVIAERALPEINAYLAAFDVHCAYLGRPGLGGLDDDIVRRLVRHTVGSLTEDTDHARAEGDDE